MPRARGANAVMALAFQSDYETPASAGYSRQPFVSSNLGEEQPLEASNVLGFGRDPQQPTLGAVDNVGDVVVPLCARNIGYWLKLLFGAPTTAAGVAATGTITFTAQPEEDATLTVAGQAFTFVASASDPDEIAIGASLGQTAANAVRVLNGSVVAGVAAATYRGGSKPNVIEITHDALGVGGNALTLAAAAEAHVSLSGATLAGGAAGGGYRHTFVSGALALPVASVEIGNPEVPNYALNWGVKANSIAITLARSGNLDATINLIAQGEATADVSVAGVPSALDMLRFSHFSGLILRDGAAIADLVGGSITVSNGLDPVPVIRGDGRIGGADEGMLAVTGLNSIRYSTRDYQAQAENGEAVEQEYSWRIPGTPWALRFVVHRVFLPKAKRPITGPGGVQADYNWQAAERTSLGRTLTVVLTNDVASY